jgi:hypothetical protein
MHTWARLLTQQTSITVNLLPTKENKLLFGETEVCFSVFRTFCFPYIYEYIEMAVQYICIYMYMLIYIYMLPFQTENRSPSDFT